LLYAGGSLEREREREREGKKKERKQMIVLWIDCCKSVCVHRVAKNRKKNKKEEGKRKEKKLFGH
jgi:hypothetical protein